MYHVSDMRYVYDRVGTHIGLLGSASPAGHHQAINNNQPLAPRRASAMSPQSKSILYTKSAWISGMAMHERGKGAGDMCECQISTSQSLVCLYVLSMSKSGFLSIKSNIISPKSPFAHANQGLVYSRVLLTFTNISSSFCQPTTLMHQSQICSRCLQHFQQLHNFVVIIARHDLY